MAKKILIILAFSAFSASYAGKEKYTPPTGPRDNITTACPIASSEDTIKPRTSLEALDDFLERKDVLCACIVILCASLAASQVF